MCKQTKHLIIFFLENVKSGNDTSQHKLRMSIKQKRATLIKKNAKNSFSKELQIITHRCSFLLLWNYRSKIFRSIIIIPCFQHGIIDYHFLLLEARNDRCPTQFAQARSYNNSLAQGIYNFLICSKELQFLVKIIVHF